MHLTCAISYGDNFTEFDFNIGSDKLFKVHAYELVVRCYKHKSENYKLLSFDLTKCDREICAKIPR